MAENENNVQGSSPLSRKEELDQFFADVRTTLPKLEQKLLEANQSGNVDLEREIANEIIILQDEADRQSEAYADILAEESEAKTKEVAKQTQLLREGTYKPTPLSSFGAFSPGEIPVAPRPEIKPPQELADKRKQALSVVTGIPVEKISEGIKNMPASERFVLGSLQSGDTEAKYLEKIYGEGSVFPVEMDGETKFVVRRKDGSAFTTDKKGIAGTAGAVAVEAPILAGEIGAFLGTLAGTKSPTIAVVASGGARAGIGTVVDAGFEKMLGLEPEWSKAMTRRGTEGFVSAVTGGVVDKATSKFLSNRVSGTFANEFADELERSAARLTARERAAATSAGRLPREITIPAGARIAGPRGLASQQVLAGELPESGFVGAMKRSHEAIIDLVNNFKNGIPLDPSKFAGVAKRQASLERQLVSEIAEKSNLSAEAIRANAEARMAAFGSIDSNVDKLGEILGESVKLADKELKDFKNEKYAEVWDVADTAGFQMEPFELLEMFQGIRRTQNRGGTANAAAVESVEKRLERRARASELLDEAESKAQKFLEKGENVPFDLQKEIDDLSALQGPINANEFDAWIKEFQNLRQDNLVGANTKDVLGQMVAKEASNKRMEIYSGYNATMPDGSVVNLGDKFREASQAVAAREELQTGLLGKVVEQELGTTKMYPREIVSTVMKEPAKIRRVMDAVAKYEAADPSRAGLTADINTRMQKAYFDSLGFGRPGVNVSSIKYDRQMVEELWGQAAPRVMKDLDELNLTLSKAGHSSQLTFDDIARLGSVLDEKSRDQVKKQIAARLRVEGKLQILRNNQLFKLASKGDFRRIDPDALTGAILSDGFTITETKTILSKLSRFSPDARNLYKGDFVREMLNKFPGGDSPAGPPYTPIFDTEAFAKAMSAPVGKSQFRKKVEAVLGEDEAQFWYDIALAFNANKIRPAADLENVRATAGFAGVSMYLAQGLGKNTRNRIMAAMLSSGSKRHGLQRALAKEVGGAAVDDAYREMFKEVFTTRTGLMALANQAKDDEEFSLYLAEMAKRFRDDDAEFNAIMERNAAGGGAEMIPAK